MQFLVLFYAIYSSYNLNFVWKMKFFELSVSVGSSWIMIPKILQLNRVFLAAFQQKSKK